jgi:hypothetical protein
MSENQREPTADEQVTMDAIASNIPTVDAQELVSKLDDRQLAALQDVVEQTHPSGLTSASESLIAETMQQIDNALINVPPSSTVTLTATAGVPIDPAMFAPIADVENPTITSTVLQLAFVAWQTRLGSDDLTPHGPSWDRFNAWWTERHDAHGFASIRDACQRAWEAASPRHGKPVQFDAWWKKIVGSQPIVEMLKPGDGEGHENILMESKVDGPTHGYTEVVGRIGGRANVEAWRKLISSHHAGVVDVDNHDELELTDESIALMLASAHRLLDHVMQEAPPDDPFAQDIVGVAMLAIHYANLDESSTKKGRAARRDRRAARAKAE